MRQQQEKNQSDDHAVIQEYGLVTEEALGEISTTEELLAINEGVNAAGEVEDDE